jgi:hypothetical protein
MFPPVFIVSVNVSRKDRKERREKVGRGKEFLARRKKLIWIRKAVYNAGNAIFHERFTEIQ